MGFWRWMCAELSMEYPVTTSFHSPARNTREFWRASYDGAHRLSRSRARDESWCFARAIPSLWLVQAHAYGLQGRAEIEVLAGIPHAAAGTRSGSDCTRR